MRDGFPRRGWVGALVAAAALAMAAACVGQTNRVSVAALQELANGSEDATSAIQAAIDALGEAGGTVRLPAGTYLHRGVIRLRSGVTLEGVGDETILVATNPAQASVAAVDATDVAVRNLKLVSRATERLSDLFNHQLTLSRTQRAVVTGVTVEGSAAAGIFIHGSTEVSVRDCRVANTLADGIHTTAGSRHVTVAANTVDNTGDDAIAVVSYRGDGAVCQDVAIHDNRVSRSHSRGLAVVGGARVAFERNVVAGTRYAGLYAASEPFFDTAGCQDIRFTDNQLQEVNRLPSPDKPYQGILLSGRPGFPVERVLVARNRLSGAGYRGLEANAHVTGARIHANVLSDIGDIGYALGGRDLVATGNTVEGAGGYGIAVTDTASGAVVVADNTVVRPNREGTGYVDAINVNATALDWLVLSANAVRLDGQTVERTLEISPGPGRLVLGAHAAAPGDRLVIGRPNQRWDSRYETASALPTTSTWDQGDVVLVEDDTRQIVVWVCERAGPAGVADGAAFTRLLSLVEPDMPHGTP